LGQLFLFLKTFTKNESKTRRKLDVNSIQPTRNLALELVRVTDSAALAAGRMMGHGDKQTANKAAADAMHLMLNSIQMEGVIVVGEGKKDEAPILYHGEIIGAGGLPQVDVAVDAVDGTRLLACGMPNSIAAAALAPRGTLFQPGPIAYMKKIVVGDEAKNVIDIEAPVEDNLTKVAKAKGKQLRELTIVVLDRPRHNEMVEQIRKSGARLRLISDGDIAGALMTVFSEIGVDMLMGVGGTAEGVLAACALRCMGGAILGQLCTQNDAQRQYLKEAGHDPDRVLTLDDLVRSDDVSFAATGITTGLLLRGVDYGPTSTSTESLAMRGSTGTVRKIMATHRLNNPA
jgi:fructose-1,6-bisphosphatase II